MPSPMEGLSPAGRTQVTANAAGTLVVGTMVPSRMAKGYLVINLGPWPLFLCDDAGDIDVIDGRSWACGPLLQGTNYLHVRYDAVYGSVAVGTAYTVNPSSRVWIRPLERDTLFNRGAV